MWGTPTPSLTKQGNTVQPSKGFSILFFKSTTETDQPNKNQSLTTNKLEIENCYFLTNKP